MGRRTAGAIAERRHALCISQQRLAEMAGVDQSRVSRAESGKLTDEVVEHLHATLDRLERRRAEVDLVETETFWQAVGDVPHRTRILGRMEAVAAALLNRSLREAEYGRLLLDCLPSESRERHF